MGKTQDEVMWTCSKGLGKNEKKIWLWNVPNNIYYSKQYIIH